MLDYIARLSTDLGPTAFRDIMVVGLTGIIWMFRLARRGSRNYLSGLVILATLGAGVWHYRLNSDHVAAVAERLTGAAQQQVLKAGEEEAFLAVWFACGFAAVQATLFAIALLRKR